MSEILFCTSPNELKLHGELLYNINNTGAKKYQRRALVACGAPGTPPTPLFWYISHFDLK
jgi:hypothetical protein